MKKYFEIYDKNKVYLTPTNAIADFAKVCDMYKGAAMPKVTFVVGTDPKGTKMLSFDEISTVCNVYGVDPELPDNEALAAIIEAANKPEPEPAPSAEERIAAALEYQNLASLPDETV